MPARRPVLKVVARRTSDSCPFLNEELAFELCPGEVVWLRGASGAGKSYTSLHLAGLAKLPGAEIHMEWDPSVAAAQRIGFLFQKGVLIDSLSLAANLALAAEAAALPADSDAIAAALEAVGLSPSADGSKMPGELSGGMLRRAALAQILAQRKRLVILDEPFVGLDPPVAEEASVPSLAATARVSLATTAPVPSPPPHLSPPYHRSCPPPRHPRPAGGGPSPPPRASSCELTPERLCIHMYMCTSAGGQAGARGGAARQLRLRAGLAHGGARLDAPPGAPAG